MRAAACVVAALAIAGCGGDASPRDQGTTVTPVPTNTTIPADIHKIRHVIVIMQENRSFDSYFGAYPGADGIEMTNGQPAVCVPDPTSGECVRPYHDRQDRDLGGPHGAAAARADIDGGAMDGFVQQQLHGMRGCEPTFNPSCGNSGATPDVMGYHTGADIPNYWAYAHDFVLQDHMFESVNSWSLPSHLYMVSEWSALCTAPRDPWSCKDAPEQPEFPPDALRNRSGTTPDSA